MNSEVKTQQERNDLMKITKDMNIGDVVRTYPQTISILGSFGMGCVGCPSAQMESIEEAAMVHGMNADEIVEKLNQNI